MYPPPHHHVTHFIHHETRHQIDFYGRRIAWRAGRLCVCQLCGVGHAWTLGMGRRPVALSRLLLRWQSGALGSCCVKWRTCATGSGVEVTESSTNKQHTLSRTCATASGAGSSSHPPLYRSYSMSPLLASYCVRRRMPGFDK